MTFYEFYLTKVCKNRLGIGFRADVFRAELVEKKMFKYQNCVVEGIAVIKPNHMQKYDHAVILCLGESPYQFTARKWSWLAYKNEEQYIGNWAFKYSMKNTYRQPSWMHFCIVKVEAMQILLISWPEIFLQCLINWLRAPWSTWR